MRRWTRLVAALALAATAVLTGGGADAQPRGDAFASNIWVTLVLEGQVPPGAEFVVTVPGAPFEEHQTLEFTPTDLGPRLSVETIGNDTIRGGDGRDRILGYGGNDRLEGGRRGDTIVGGSGVDTILGQDGNDALGGGTQHDTCNGGTGQDTAVGCEVKNGIP